MLELKLRPPSVRPGLVTRRPLLEKVSQADNARVVTVIAPPGYGKTTLLTQLSESEKRPTAWLTIDHLDNDPATLLAGLSGSLVAAGMVDEETLDDRALTSDQVLTKGVPNLLEAFERRGIAGVLLLDQVDSLRSSSSLDVVGSLLAHLPNGLDVMLASRSGSGLPLAALRSRGVLVEITMHDLAMDECEAKVLIDGAGVAVGESMTDLMERTEGWPVGLYLTALAIKAEAPAVSALDVRGDDFFVADYLRDEVLGRVSEAEMSFLTSSSILTKLSGSLCDFILETTRSGRYLERLERSNLLIVPLDRTRTWFRYHSLLRDFLISELERTRPDVVASLHSRAATWLEEDGQLELAIEHAKTAGEGDRVARMVSRVARVTYADGRMDTLFGWLDWLESNGIIGRFPDLAAIGAFARSLSGDPRGTDRLGLYAYTSADGGPLDDEQLGPYARLLRSFQIPMGPEKALGDARAALDGFARSSDWQHIALGAEALALTCLRDEEAADEVWEEGIAISEDHPARPFKSLALAERARIAIGRADMATAEDLLARAMAEIEEGGLEKGISSALAFTLAARMTIRRGEIEEAEALIGRAGAIRPVLNSALPTISLRALLEMTKTFVELADIAGARRVMREASDIVAARPRLGALSEEHDELKERLSSLPAGSVGPSSLTSAELRLLPLLVTHLTYPEIGDRLFVSRHTVKTQAMSIYRKLGVSSRGEAVEAARSIGLLGV